MGTTVIPELAHETNPMQGILSKQSDAFQAPSWLFFTSSQSASQANFVPTVGPVEQVVSRDVRRPFVVPVLRRFFVEVDDVAAPSLPRDGEQAPWHREI
jgi:hypothetical protein